MGTDSRGIQLHYKTGIIMISKMVFTNSIQKCDMHSWIFPFLPECINAALDKADTKILDNLSEIRLRADSVSAVTSNGANYVIAKDGVFPYSLHPVIIGTKDIDDFIYKVCRGSVYSHEGSISNGFITINGVRIGISGDVTVKNGAVSGFSSIRSVNIRLPKHIDGCADGLLRHITSDGFESLGGILVASPPGVGKTTVLRELAIKLSNGINNEHTLKQSFRVSVIDERCELYIPSLFKNCSADIYSGIPKHTGIEFASRTMSPEVIIFDEIGSDADAKAVMSAHFGGCTFISSIHAGSVYAAMNKRIIKNLYEEGIFTHIYFLERTENGIKGTLHKVAE